MLDSAATSGSNSSCSAVYRPRRPAQGILHKIVRENLETYLSATQADSDFSTQVPPHIESALREYLKCGILAHGFARAYCAGCGHDFLIVLSCKGRDICPSCSTRRMVETAAHMVDNVLPRVQFRQWVLSVPKRVRWHMLHKPEVANGLLSVFLRAMETTALPDARAVGRRSVTIEARPHAPTGCRAIRRRFPQKREAPWAALRSCAADAQVRKGIDDLPGGQAGSNDATGSLVVTIKLVSPGQVVQR